ncbi:uncharacterized protein [Tenebrio molitor]
MFLYGFLFSTILLSHLGNPLQCYKCSGSSRNADKADKACVYGYSNVEKQECPYDHVCSTYQYEMYRVSRLMTMIRVVTILVISGLLDLGVCIRCYVCTSEASNSQYEYDACLYGDERYLRAVTCTEPSVCTAYHYQTLIPGSLNQLSTSRGCQALRYGATCEDIFNDLRRTGSVLPGQHICTTCSEDLCNEAPSPGGSVLCAMT